MSDYRLAGPLVARVMGTGLVLLAVVVFSTTLVTSLAGGPLVVVVGVAVPGLAIVVGAVIWLGHRVAVVHLDDEGYRVRVVRGVGVTAASWPEVQDVAAAHVADEPCVVLRLRDGRTTTIPVRVLAADRDEFVRDLQGFLQRGHGLRRL